MDFVISSTELLNHLQAIGGVINPKNTLPMLDNFLFQIKDSKLLITASDLETTFNTTIVLENANGDGNIAIKSSWLSELLKEFPEQPLTFNIDLETFSIKILSENGEYITVGQNGDDFPRLPTIDKDKASTIKVSADVLLNGIGKTIFATASDELRPVMNGIYFELSDENLTFVASDAHKLVRYKRADAKSDLNTSFILPKKPASLLKNILPKQEGDITLEFDDKNAFFTLTNYNLVCRLIEGNYPSYQSVIPTENPNKLTVNRNEFYNILKRVSVCANQASNLTRLNIKANELIISAQDVDFSISGEDKLNCQYEGADMEIGFKSIFLLEILSNLTSEEVVFELSEPTRAGIILPAGKDNENEDVLMLLMPMMINA